MRDIHMRSSTSRCAVMMCTMLFSLLVLVPASKAADVSADSLHAGSGKIMIAAAQQTTSTAVEAPDYDSDEYGDEEESELSVADPLQPWNTVWYHFNDKLYFWLLKPVAQGYKAVVPTIARTGVSNFFNNLATPIRFVNCLLQGKMKDSGSELGRFVINSTVGVLGFGEVASGLAGLEPPTPEDLGQTLGSYGVGNGLYIIWPIFGPSTVRDTVGLVGDYFLDPVTYIDDFGIRVAVKSVDTVNATSFRLGDYEALKDAALDPYLSIRDAYIQNRAKKVAD